MRKTYPLISCYCVRDNEVALELPSDFGLAVREDSGLVSIQGVEEAAEVAKKIIGARPQEHGLVLGLNSKSEIIFADIVSKGSISSAFLSPDMVFRSAIIHGCAAIIIAHNHPSGSITPSDADRDTTRTLRSAGEILKINVLDSLIVSPDSYYSLKEKGDM